MGTGNSRRTVVQRTGLGLGHGNQLIKRVDLELGAHCQKQWGLTQQGHGFKVFLGVGRNLAEHQRVHCEHRPVCDDESVAIRRGCTQRGDSILDNVSVKPPGRLTATSFTARAG